MATSLSPCPSCSPVAPDTYFVTRTPFCDGGLSYLLCVSGNFLETTCHLPDAGLSLETTAPDPLASSSTGASSTGAPDAATSSSTSLGSTIVPSSGGSVRGTTASVTRSGSSVSTTGSSVGSTASSEGSDAGP